MDPEGKDSEPLILTEHPSDAHDIVQMFRHLAEWSRRADDTDHIRFSLLLESLGERAYGLALLIFALPACLPMPPGVPMICGLGILLIALQYPLARPRLRLPNFIENRRVPLKRLGLITRRLLPFLEWLQSMCKPRYGSFFSTPIRLLAGVLMVVLGFLMFLPIPFLGNMPPAFATTVAAIGIVQKDGLIFAAGLGLGFAAASITIAATIAAIAGAAWLI